MKRFAAIIVIMLVTTLLLGLVGTSTSAAPPAAFPDVIQLPKGFHPEGIVVGNGSDFYVGSLLDGAIYKGDLRTGQGDLLVLGQAGRIAVGLSFDARSNQLFVAGGPTGAAYVFNAGTGQLVAEYQFADPASPATFVNDVVVTRTAAYFTDSFQPVFYRLPLGPGGSLPNPTTFDTITLTGDFDFAAGEFNSNGIEAAANGKMLIIANSYAGALYRVDPATGSSTAIDLGNDAVPSADGLVLAGKDLYVVQNFLNQIAAVRLNPDFTAGSVEQIILDPEFKIPTTAARFGQSLYAVNARFDVAPPPFFGGQPQPDLPFQVVRVDRR